MSSFSAGNWEGEIVFDGRNETDEGDSTIKTQTIPSRHVAVSKPAEPVPSHVTTSPPYVPPPHPPSLWAGIISEVFNSQDNSRMDNLQWEPVGMLD